MSRLSEDSLESIRTLTMDDPTVPNQPPRNRRKKVWIICCSVFFVLLILVIVLVVLFLIERPVDFELMPLEVHNSTLDASPEGFTLPVDPTVKAHNSNFFDIYLQDVQVRGYNPSYAGGAVPLAIGNVSGINLESRADTFFDLPLIIEYKNAEDPNMVFFNEILTNCSESKNINLSIKILIHYHMYLKGGQKEDNRLVSVACPINPDKARQLKEFTGSGF